MFKINEIVETKSGEKVKPFLVQKNMVYCFTKNGKTIIKKLSDFDHTVKKEKEIIIVTPIAEITDEFHIIEEPVIEEPVIEEPIIEEPVIEEPVIEEPVIEEPVIEEPIIEEPIIEEPIIEEPQPPINTNIPDEDYI